MIYNTVFFYYPLLVCILAFPIIFRFYKRLTIPFRPMDKILRYRKRIISAYLLIINKI